MLKFGRVWKFAMAFDLITFFCVCMYTNKMHKILVIKLYFLLDAVHVSDYISPSSGATL